MARLTSSITVKGQVTIPAVLRRELGLKQGDEVAFEIENDKLVIRPIEKDVSALFGLVKSKRRVSLEEMDDAIRRRAGR